jgi:hypothetical protein
MSLEQNLTNVSILAGEDLSAKQYLGVAVATDNSGVKRVATLGAQGIGVLQNAPVLGQPAAVGILGITKVIVGVGDVASAGLKLQFDATGAVIAWATAGHYACGVSLDAGVAGGLIRMLVGVNNPAQAT